MTIARSREQIVEWLNAHRELDLVGALRKELVTYLPWELARAYMGPAAAAQAEARWRHLERQAAGIRHEEGPLVLDRMREHWPQTLLELEQRHTRCVLALACSYAAWTWLLGDDATSEALLAPVREGVRAGVLEVGALEPVLMRVAREYGLTLAKAAYVQ